ncbi:MAG: universal stress protein [Acidimicrobiia bacterium]|nr:universal stress protein [Acidimicrobiia bacterium]MDH4306776.1 universal stress protein [Acidimicrobiia bacterium]MDH5295272.1 universal stress protein [Acidimicrobiia bacterium]
MKIVVGFIDTPEGHAAIDAAIAEAQLRGGSLVVVNSMHGGSREDEHDYIATAEAFEALAQRLRDGGVEFETHEFVRGNSPAQDVIAAVEQTGAGMIVIGIRERSAAGKLLLGSNALDILHDTPVPVLCVKP